MKLALFTRSRFNPMKADQACIAIVSSELNLLPSDVLHVCSLSKELVADFGCLHRSLRSSGDRM